MKKFARLTLAGVLLTATIASAGPKDCAVAVEGPSRADYKERLLAMKVASEKSLQEQVDLDRRLIEFFFVKTNFFFKNRTGNADQNILPRLDQESLASYLKIQKENFLKTYSGDKDEAYVRISRFYKISIPEARELYALAEIPEAIMAKSLLPVLVDVEKKFEKSRDLRLRARVDQKDHLSAYSLGDQFIPVHIMVSVVSAVGGLGGAWGLENWAPAFHFAGNSVVMSAVALGNLAALKYHTFSTPRLREKFNQFRAWRSNRAVKKDLQIQVKPKVAVDMEKTDAAFEKSWADWKMNSAMAESAKNKLFLTSLTKRSQLLSLVLETSGTWQLPDGGLFAEAANNKKYLSPEKMEQLKAGIERKISQLDLLSEELQWLKDDSAKLLENLNSEIDQAGGNLAHKIQEREILLSLIPNFDRQAEILAARDEFLRFTESQMELGPESFQEFVTYMKEQN